MSRLSAALTSATFPATHLTDEAVVAFADAVLRGGARTRAEQHLNACAECREAVREQRNASAVLRSAPLPCLPSGLADRLRNLPSTTPLPSVQAPAALTADSRPVFAAFDPAAAAASHPDAPIGHETVQLAAAQLPLSDIPAPGSAFAARTASGVGLSALAVGAIAVSLLASTASTAGGAPTPRPAPAPPVAAVSSTASGGASGRVGGIELDHLSTGQLNLTNSP